MKKIFSLFLALLFLQTGSANSASSDWHENQSKGAKTRLIASYYKNQAGEKKLIAGIEFKIASGWKIYGSGSDGIGMPPSFDFTNSKNLAKHTISWPQAISEEEKIGDEKFTYSSYKNEVIIPIEIDLEQANQAVELNVELNYGLCKEICVPASENFTLQIPDEIDTISLNEIQKFFPNQISDGKEEPKSMNKNLALFSAILLAIFGGAILNIMPCVLPVLSIKLISVIRHSESEISHIRFSFLSTIIGILSCFVVFALCASIIKLTGNSLGWGLQFQNPYFLIFLIVILIVFVGNLLGVFEINFDRFLATILNKKISKEEEEKNIFLPNFLSGILAVLLATPCSAPFLGAAISFALVQSFFVIFLIFFFIGIGFSLPYFILIFAPKLVYILPRPGNWMIQIKQLMAGLLAATVIWLIYVLSHNIGALPAFLAGIIAVTILACFKIKTEFFKFLAIATLAILSFLLPMKLQKQQKISKDSYESFWVEFDEAKLHQLIIEGKTVVVDITADWCLSCKFNKIRVLQDKEVMAKLNGNDIIAMRGDITNPNEKIINFLHENNRFAIPFNAVYGPKAPDGLLASELLTKKELFELIEKAQ
jgi:suppressor for copper-sensitivity B